MSSDDCTTGSKGAEGAIGDGATGEMGDIPGGKSSVADCVIQIFAGVDRTCDTSANCDANAGAVCAPAPGEGGSETFPEVIDEYPFIGPEVSEPARSEVD